jgi:hypothetical protein
MATVVLVPDDDGGSFAIAGADDSVPWEPLKPGNDVLDAEIPVHAFAKVRSHAPSITAAPSAAVRRAGRDRCARHPFASCAELTANESPALRAAGARPTGFERVTFGSVDRAGEADDRRRWTSSACIRSPLPRPVAAGGRWLLEPARGRLGHNWAPHSPGAARDSRRPRNTAASRGQPGHGHRLEHVCRRRRRGCLSLIGARSSTPGSAARGSASRGRRTAAGHGPPARSARG